VTRLRSLLLAAWLWWLAGCLPYVLTMGCVAALRAARARGAW
jgi:hypothetical protein